MFKNKRTIYETGVKNGHVIHFLGNMPFYVHNHAFSSADDEIRFTAAAVKPNNGIKVKKRTLSILFDHNDILADNGKKSDK